MGSQGERSKAPTPMVPTSWGDLIDKITILEIKNSKIENPTALANVQKELALLQKAAEGRLEATEIIDIKSKLYLVNEELWNIEDRIREKERANEFDGEFISLARSVYKRNDERAALKRLLNVTLASEIIEEKSYKKY